MKRRIISSILCLSLALAVVSCGKVEQGDSRRQENEHSTVDGENDREPNDPDQPIDNGYWHDETESSETSAAQPQIEGAVEFIFPEGAGSIYELYTIVLNYLNNGFNYNDLSSVYDPILTYTFDFKAEMDFASGLSLEESCNLMARLVNIAEEQGIPLDEDGEFEDDYIDAEAFRSEIPDMEDADEFVEDLYAMLYYHSMSDGVNPFHTQQTSWEVVSEENLETERFDFYEDFVDGFEEAFPNIYEVSLGTYRGEGTDLWHMGFYCFEYNGRYYFLEFSTVLGTAGG